MDNDIVLVDLSKETWEQFKGGNWVIVDIYCKGCDSCTSRTPYGMEICVEECKILKLAVLTCPICTQTSRKTKTKENEIGDDSAAQKKN